MQETVTFIPSVLCRYLLRFGDALGDFVKEYINEIQ